MKERYPEKILIVDDDPDVGPLLKEILETGGYSSVDFCQSVDEAVNKFYVNSYLLVITDYRLGKRSGLDLLETVREHRPEVPVIMITGFGSVDLAVEAMKKGAFDFLEKPLHPEKVRMFVKRALDHGALRTEIIRLKKQPSLATSYHGIIGKSASMKKVFDLIERIKGSEVNILITGPSGSGKEMVAAAFHKTSPRSEQNFVTINCSAIPENLLEGELFGYKKGAFTDARTDKLGLFQEAHGGTIFLDEIGDMPLSLQPKILRVIQEKEVRPLGSTQTIHVDARIVAATNQDLKKKCQDKLFREDLYYRLNVVRIELPALSERAEDIPLLIDFFLDRFQKNGHKIKGVSQTAMKLLLDYPWPGQVRELQNVIERAVLLAQDEYILPEDLPFSKKEIPAISVSDKAKQGRALDEIERDYILEVLKSVNGNRSKAASILKIERKTLYNKLAKYGI